GAYFDRLRARVRAAAARKMYVSVMLFEGWGLQWHGAWRWRAHPFNAANNVNGVNGDPNGDGTGTETHTLAVPAVTRVQDAYVRKVVDTLNGFDNVLYEIANESGAYSTAWQYHVIDVIARRERGKRKRHPIGMTFQHAHGSIAALFNSRAHWVSPAGLEYIDDPPEGTGRKVIINDTDHHCGGCGDDRFAWKSFLRGLNPIYMDEMLDDPRRNSIRIALGQTRRFAERIDLARSRPHSALASTGYCLASPGREYLAYQPENGAFTLDLRGGTGEYQVQWFEVASGRLVDGSRVSGGGVVTLTPPFAGQAVAHLRRA
ncbi:MAG: hypothetical protein M3310_02900, partial [Actinomycetota bacterium]|nr:hypothetical protein [Actinomycetota bacterium]